MQISIMIQLLLGFHYNYIPIILKYSISLVII